MIVSLLGEKAQPHLANRSAIELQILKQIHRKKKSGIPGDHEHALSLLHNLSNDQIVGGDGQVFSVTNEMRAEE